MKLPGLKRRGRQNPVNVVVEEVTHEEGEEEVDGTCTFDDDADPSIERCWDVTDGMMAKNATGAVWPLQQLLAHREDDPTALLLVGGAFTLLLVVVLGLVSRKQKSTATTTAQGQEEQDEQATNAADSAKTAAAAKTLDESSAPTTTTNNSSNLTAAETRLKELRLRLERETKEKQGLSEQNNALKSALEERKATVQMFTAELQSRDEQLAIFEQEQVKVKNELYHQIEALKNELQTQETVQQQNLNNMDGQCADLSGKVEGLMKELASREEQWEKFEKDAKAKEIDSAAQIEAIQKEFAAKEQAQKESIQSKAKECAELGDKLKGLTNELKASEAHLATFSKQREKWNEAATEMKRLLKEKREEIVGLTTRMELFLGELKSREERVAGLQQQLSQKKEHTETELKDLRMSLEEQTKEQESWNVKTNELQLALAEKETQAQELAAKVQSLTTELGSTSDKVAALETTVQDKEFVISSKRKSIEETLEEEQKKRNGWSEQFNTMSRLLKAKEEECACLTARVEIFATELQSRETIVGSLEEKIQDKSSFIAGQLEPMDEELKNKQAFRDTWSQSTTEIRNRLEERKEQCIGLSTRVELFRVELQKREERVAALEIVLKEREDASAEVLEPYRTQLKAQQEDLDNWTEKWEEIKDLLQKRKSECVGLTTRLNLFKQKLTEYENQFDVTSRKYDAKMGTATEDLTPMKEELQKQQEERDSWSKKTTEIARLLQNRQSQCSGLSTRALLFKRQTKIQEEQVTTLEEKVKDLEEQFDLKITPLKKELKNQQEGLDSWRESTGNVERLLKQTEQDCLDLTEQLKVQIVRLRGSQEQVAHLQTKVNAKEDLVATEKEMYLAQRQKEKDELSKWANNTKDLQRLLFDKEGQIVNLNTRLSLFESELETRQTTVTDLESKLKEKKTAFDMKIITLQNDLKFQREQRDHCLESTLHMNKSMKEVKEPCIGLTTRLTLFRKELEGREERVKILGEQLCDKEEIAASVLDPLKKELAKQIVDRNKWNDSTLDIFWLLKQKQDSTLGLTTRLELFMSELQKKEEVVDATEAKLKENAKGLAQMENLKDEIKEQEEQKLKWQNSTDEIEKLLQRKEEQRAQNSDEKVRNECISLSSKLQLFRGELKRRDEKVKNLRSTLEHRTELLRAEEASLEKQIPALKDDRDSWMEKTLDINRTLKDVQGQCVGLSTRWELFKNELKGRKESVAALEARLKEKDVYYSSLTAPYSNELKVQTELKEKWVATIEKMESLLKKKESECITFTTKLETAIDELTSRKEKVASLEVQLSNAKELSEYELTSLGKQLSVATENLTSWKASTENVERLIKEKRQECANLRVRLQVFNRQVETQDNRIATLEAAFKAKQDETGEQMELLQNQLREQKSARDEGVNATLKLNQQIKAKEQQCNGISVRLSLFRTELENREKCVATLENKLKDTEGLSSLMLDPVKAQLEIQREELAKWTKNTKDVNQQLEQRDEERVGLATRLKLFQSQLKTMEENVAKLEERVREREASVASEVAPYKNALEAQRAERDRWTESTREIQRLLNDRKSQITGLTTRLSLFRKEVRHRERVVSSLESKLEEKEAEIEEFKIGPIRTEVEKLQQERDQWKDTTTGIERMLETKRGEIHGLNTRLACFTIELQKREEACNLLAKRLSDKKGLYGSQVEVLQSELAMQREQRDKWRDTTADMKKQVEERKTQCSGLTTRVELFQKEIKGHDQTIANLKSKLQENDTAVAELEDLKKELETQKERRDALKRTLVETDQLLKDKKEECASLATRLSDFRQQLKERMDRLASTETTIKEKEEMSAAQIESLKVDLQAQSEQRDKWTETTEELKKLLEEKESQCSIISAELELLTSLQVAE